MAMAIVPWGILVQPDVAPRILRWAAVKRVQVEMIHGRDAGTPTTLWSVVTIETDHERLAGRAAGAVAIERLIAHLAAYAEEQAQAVALDLEGRRGAEGPFEPVFEPLLSAARAAIVGVGPDSTRLCLPAERVSARGRSRVGGDHRRPLRQVLADRVAALARSAGARRHSCRGARCETARGGARVARAVAPSGRRRGREGRRAQARRGRGACRRGVRGGRVSP